MSRWRTALPRSGVRPSLSFQSSSFSLACPGAMTSKRFQSSSASHVKYLGSHQEVDDHVISRVKGFIFDMDGVLWRGKTLIERAREAVCYLRDEQRKHIFFVTNSSALTAIQNAAKLQRLGFADVCASSVYSSATATAMYLKSIAFKGKVYVIGLPALKEEIASICEDVEVVDNEDHRNVVVQMEHIATQLGEKDREIGAVVMGFDPKVNYFQLSYAGRILQSQPSCLFLATNLDLHFPLEDSLLPGTGPFVSVLAGVAKREPIVVGKPGPFIIDHICRENSLDPSDLCVVGDSLLTDIQFGRTNGTAAMMVETGVNTQEDALRTREEHQPHFVISSIASMAPHH